MAWHIPLAPLQGGDVLFLLSVEFVDDKRNGTVTRYIASRAEAIHGDVERNHQRLFALAEA